MSTLVSNQWIISRPFFFTSYHGFLRFTQECNTYWILGRKYGRLTTPFPSGIEIQTEELKLLGPTLVTILTNATGWCLYIGISFKKFALSMFTKTISKPAKQRAERSLIKQEEMVKTVMDDSSFRFWNLITLAIPFWLLLEDYCSKSIERRFL